MRLQRIDPKKIGVLLLDEEIKKIFETTKKIVSDVISGNHDAVIIRDEKTEVLPLKLGKLKGELTDASSFIEGLDTVFTESILAKGRSIQSSGSDKKIKQLETQIFEQEKAIKTVKERSKNITGVANSLFGMTSSGNSFNFRTVSTRDPCKLQRQDIKRKRPLVHGHTR